MLSLLRSEGDEPFLAAARLIEDHPRTVVFVTPMLRARETKLAQAARLAGWRTVLLYAQTTPFEPDSHFDVAIRAKGNAEMHDIAMALQPRLCHVFSGAIDEGAERFVGEKPSPVILDLNDVFVPSLFNYCQERFEPTRRCLALADAVCARDLQMKFAERLDGYTLPKKVLLFPEYCGINGPQGPGARPKLPENEVHVVSVGSFTLETHNMHDSAYLQMARMLTDQRVHFHIYPHWSYRKNVLSGLKQNLQRDFREFMALAGSTSYLHLHESLSLEELALELPQYDFGIISGGSPELGQKLELLTQNYMDCCYSGRIADYLDARLPVLINQEVSFNYRLLRHYGIQVDLAGITEAGFRERLLDAKRDKELAARVDHAAERMSIQRNALRLGEFYARAAPASTVDSLRSPLLHRLRRLPLIGAKVRGFEERMHNTNRHMLQVAARNIDLEQELRQEALQTNRLRLRTAILEQKIRKRVEQSPVPSDPSHLTISEQQNAQSLSADLMGMDATRGNLAKTQFIKSFRDGSAFDSLQPDDVSGLLNWPEISKPNERANGFHALVEMLAIFTSRPSKFNDFSNAWRMLAWKNLDELLRDGFSSFKRTLGSNYFNFFVQAGDPQIAAVEALLSPEELGRAQEAAAQRQPEPDFHLADQRAYWYFVAALWQFVRKHDRLGLTNQFHEPSLGRPLTLQFEGATVSQDLSNSLIEYYAMEEQVAFGAIETVMEIGAGHGRDAHIILSLHPHIRYVIVDIPPTLYISQRYLSSLFEDRRVFYFRDFEKYDDVREEVESSAVVFLMPYQLEKLPPKTIDHTISISSFGEMTRLQVDRYFEQIDRVTRGTFYFKQWMVSFNPFDSLDFLQNDYPIKPTWQELYHRPCPVQDAFFEALYRIDAP